MCEACYGSCPNCHPELYAESDCPVCEGDGEVYYEYDESVEAYKKIDRIRYSLLESDMRHKEICEHCDGKGYV